MDRIGIPLWFITRKRTASPPPFVGGFTGDSSETHRGCSACGERYCSKSCQRILVQLKKGGRVVIGGDEKNMKVDVADVSCWD